MVSRGVSQQLRAGLTDDIWVWGLAAKTAWAAALPSGVQWPRAVNKIRKIYIYEGAADKVLDPPALSYAPHWMTDADTLQDGRSSLYWSDTECAHGRIRVMSVVILNEVFSVYVSFHVYVGKYSVMSCGKGCQIQRLSSE